VELHQVSLGTSSTSDQQPDGNHDKQSLLAQCVHFSYKVILTERQGLGTSMTNQRNQHNAPAVTSQPRTIYLTAYNILFASLWASIFIRAISSAQSGQFELFNSTEPYARWIQTASLVEVLHATFGTFITVT
jgi:hypothetical protein